LLCEVPANILNGKVRVLHGDPKLGLELEGSERYEEGSVAEYTCDVGYWLHPTSHSKHSCHHGQWIGDTPQCVSKGCNDPDPVMNGYFIELSGSYDQQYPPGARLQFVCHTGYILKGSDLFICNEVRGWSPRRKPKCEPSQELLDAELCSVPPEVLHTLQKLIRGIVTAEGAFHGTTVEYRCRPGFRNILAPCLAHSLTCHKGHWHGTSPKCEEFNSCIAPPDIAHGYMYDSASSYPLQSQVFYSCDPGYRLVGPSVLTCEDSGCWAPKMPPVCQLSHHFEDEVRNERTLLDMHTILVATTGSVIGILLIVLALILYQRAVGPKLVRLRNSGSGNNLPPPPPNCPPNPPLPVAENDPDRVALIPFPDEGVPPSYEEAVRHRPAVMFEAHGGTNSGRYTPHSHRTRSHRVVVPSVRRSRHRDNPDNISYQSIGSARHSSSTSRSMSMRSWSACDSLGSTDTVAVSDSTNVTVDTQSGTSSSGSQAPSCRALAGSLASFDTSSLVNNEVIFSCLYVQHLSQSVLFTPLCCCGLCVFYSYHAMSRRQTTKEDVRAIIALFNMGHTMKQISRETAGCFRSVKRLTKEYQDTGRRSLPIAKPKTGRPKIITHRTRNVVKRLVDSQPSIRVKEVKEINSNILQHISSRTVQRCIYNDVRCHRFHAHRKPGLTQRQKRLRIDICKKYQLWEPERWQHVLCETKIK
ncbi:hypothetical protein SK128_026495, partial [Halocaridina rubra]